MTENRKEKDIADQQVVVAEGDAGGNPLSADMPEKLPAGGDTSATAATDLGKEAALLVEFYHVLGTSGRELAETLLEQVARASEIQGLRDFLGCKSLAAAFRGIAPKDDLEALLASQMVATHFLAMRFLGMASPTKYGDKVIDANLNRGTKLQRTFLAQLEALKRHRTNGEQRMVVEHVNVQSGGQAIVGQVAIDRPKE